jgi:hypothetical protein
MQERAPRRAPRLLPPPPKRVHLRPRTDLSIYCRSTHNWSSVNLDYYNKYYSGRCSTYKLDRTIVTAEAPRMLAMSTSPPSAGASSYTPAATASSAAMAAGAVPSCAPVATTSSTAAAAGSVLSCGAGGWRSNCAKSSSTVGAGLRLLAGSPTVSHPPSSPSSTGSAGGTSYIQGRLLISKRTRTMGTRVF